MKKEYFEAIKNRYKNAEKDQKTRILDEFCSNCSYNRKCAIRLLNSNSPRKKKKKRAGRKKKYYKDEIKNFLKQLWQATNLIYSKRLKSIIPLWLPYYEKKISENTKALLLEISAATIDRIFQASRRKYKKLGLLQSG